MEKLYTVSKNKTGSYGSDDEFLVAKFRLKLKKVGKTTRPFRCDLNQILGSKAMTNLDGILKSTDIILPTNVHLVKSMVFLVVMYRCELNRKEG